MKDFEQSWNLYIETSW